jgi:hypothetical protein
MTDLDPKIAKCLRLLASDQDGEMLAAARALKRALKKGGLDIHALAARIETPANSIINAREREAIYRKGFNDAAKRAAARNDGDDGDDDGDAEPSWAEMARVCQRRAHWLSAKEKDFIANMAKFTRYREPTEAQAKWLRDIFHRLGSRRR